MSSETAERSIGATGGLRHIVEFRLGEERYGIDASDVLEIARPGAITRVPEQPAFVLGLTNLRGRVAPVIDLGLRLALPACPGRDERRILVVGARGKLFGLVVDVVTGIRRVRVEAIDAATRHALAVPGVRGLAQWQDHVVILLEPEPLLEALGSRTDG